MVNARRAARELALKVLFQVDVGKQPLDEVMEGALDQIRQTVDHPINQHLHELQAELKRTIEERRAELSTQSLRQVRNVARSLQSTLGLLHEQIAARVRAMVDRPAENASEEVNAFVSKASEEAVETMRRAGDRETLQPDIVAALVREAIRRAALSATTLARNSAQGHAAAAYLHSLVSGVLEQRKEIDRQVAGLSEGWALDRQPAVDRNILRMAAYEVLYRPDVPPGASINEAVELAKKYSTAESGRFVNGVLGALAASVGRDERKAPDLAASSVVEGGSSE
jgi:transcription antitermination protein NusB